MCTQDPAGTQAALPSASSLVRAELTGIELRIMIAASPHMSHQSRTHKNTRREREWGDEDQTEECGLFEIASSCRSAVTPRPCSAASAPSGAGL
jgi:hypothetical protein